MNNVILKISRMQTERGWTANKFATEAGLTAPAVRKWFQNDMYPSIPALMQVCECFGITMADFFAEGNLVELTPDKKALIDDFAILTPTEQSAVKAVIKGYKDSKN